MALCGLRQLGLGLLEVRGGHVRLGGVLGEGLDEDVLLGDRRRQVGEELRRVAADVPAIRGRCACGRYE